MYTHSRTLVQTYPASGFGIPHNVCLWQMRRQRTTCQTPHAFQMPCKRGRAMATGRDQFRSQSDQSASSRLFVTRQRPVAARACFTSATRARRASLGVRTGSEIRCEPHCCSAADRSRQDRCRTFASRRERSLASSVAYSATASAWSVFMWLTMSVSAAVSSGASATLDEELCRRKIDDPAEAADVVAAGDLERVHGKVGKVGVGPGRRRGARETAAWPLGSPSVARGRSA